MTTSSFSKKKYKKPLTELPSFSPFRGGVNKKKFASKLSPEKYVELWKKAVAKAKKQGKLDDSVWKEFEKKHGELILPNGRKLKPGKAKIPNSTKSWDGGSLSTAADKALDYRKWRGDIATYVFGGTPMSTSEAGGMTEFGDILEAHHKFGNAELAPWFDDIIEMLKDEDPEVRARGVAMVESAKEYFKDSPYKLGNVEENYELLTRGRHTGGNVKGADYKIERPWEAVHGGLGTGSKGKKAKDLHKDDPFRNFYGEIEHGDPGNRVTGQGGASQWVNPRTGEPMPLTTKIRNLDWDIKDLIISGKHTDDGLDMLRPGKLSRWSTLRDFLFYSMPIREEYFELVKENRTLDSPNEIKAIERARLGIPTVNLDAETVRRWGTIGDVTGSKLNKADQIANFTMGVASGNWVQTLSAGAGLAITNQNVQEELARQIAKRASKSTLKLIPGLDVGLSGLEAYGYLTEGKFDQMGIALASGAVGWVPLVGDAAAAALDLTNTTLDVTRMDWNRQGNVDTEADLDRKKVKYSMLDKYSPNTRSLRSLKF